MQCLVLLLPRLHTSNTSCARCAFAPAEEARQQPQLADQAEAAMWGRTIQVCHWMSHHVTAIPAASQQPVASCEELFENETGQLESLPNKPSTPRQHAYADC